MFRTLSSHFKGLAGYNSRHEAQFNEIFKHLNALGFIEPRSPDFLPFLRLEQSLVRSSSADEALKILTFIHQYFDDLRKAFPEEKTTSALKLLDTCAVSLEPILFTSRKDESKKTLEEKTAIDVSDLATLTTDPRFFKYDPKKDECSETLINEREKPSDLPMMRLRKRLHQQGLYIDSAGMAYRRGGVRVPVGSKSDALSDAKIVSLVDAFNYTFVHHYFFICEILSRGTGEFFQHIASYGIPVTNVLIPSESQRKYASLITRLSPGFIAQEYQRLNHLFERNTLCTGILEEKALPKHKSLAQAFSEIPAEELGSLGLPDQELFLLLFFHLKKPSDFLKNVWPAVTPKNQSPLQKLIEGLEKHSFNQVPGLSAALKRVIPSAAPLAIAEMMLKMPEHFESQFVCRFVIKNLPAREQNTFLLQVCIQNSTNPEQQLAWLNSFSDLSVRTQTLTVLKQLGAKLYPASEALLFAASSSSSSSSSSKGSSALSSSGSSSRPTPSAPAYDELVFDDDIFAELRVPGKEGAGPDEVKPGISTKAPPVTRATAASDTSITGEIDQKAEAPQPIYDPKKLLAQLKKRSSSNILQLAQEQLSQYSKTFLEEMVSQEGIKSVQNLKVIKDKKLHGQRYQAFVFLRDTLTISDLNWTQFTSLCSEPNFKADAGHFDSGLLASVRAPKDSLWHVVSFIKTKIQKQAQFFAEFKDQKKIAQLFHDDQFWSVLTIEDVALIYQHGNQEAFVHNALRYNRFELIQKLVSKLSHEEQVIFYKHLGTRKNLELLFNKDQLFDLLTPEDLRSLFIHGDQTAFLEFLLLKNKIQDRLKNWKTVRLPTASGEFELTTDVIRKLMDPRDIDGSNAIRARLNMPAVIPHGYVRAGLDGLLDGSEMTTELAYQLEDSDLHNIDTYLIRTYKERGVIFNPVLDPDFKGAEEQKISGRPSNIAFYHIPANIHPILVSCDLKAAEAEDAKWIAAAKAEEEARSKGLPIPKRPPISPAKSEALTVFRFLKKVKLLVDSYDPIKATKPVVFTVWLNTGKNHYIPCLIYKPPVGKVQIVTINPSPETVLPERLSGRPSPKDNINRMIHTAFSHIFPGCEHRDLKQTKQIRQRDCGFRTATDFEDIFKSATSEHPVVEISKENQLVVHPERLSISFNNQPWRIRDERRGVYLYSPEAMDVAAQDRQTWAARLGKETHVNYYVLPEQPSITTPLSFSSGIEEYSYKRNVMKQNHGDRLGELRGRLVILLFGAEGIPPQPEITAALQAHKLVSKITASSSQIEEFKRTRKLPEFKQMPLYVKALREGFDKFQSVQAALAKRAGLHYDPQPNPVDEIIAIGRELGDDAGDLSSPEKYLQAILLDNLKLHYPEVILAGFEQFLERHQLASDKERPLDFIYTYFKTDITADTRFKELKSSNESLATQLYQTLSKKAEVSWRQKLSYYYRKMIMEGIEYHLLDALKRVSVERLPDAKEIHQIVLNEFKKDPRLAPAFTYFATYELTVLESLFSKAIAKVTQFYHTNTLNFLKDQFLKCDLRTFPKPKPPYDLFHPEFLSLLPREEKGFPQTIVRAQDLFTQTKGSPTSSSKINLLGQLIRFQLNGTESKSPFTETYDQCMQQVLRREAHAQLTSAETLSFVAARTPSELSHLLQSDEESQRIAATPLKLFDNLAGLESRRPFYTRAIHFIVRAFQDLMRETLDTKLQATYELIINEHYLIGRDNLTILFNNMESAGAERTLHHVVNDLVRIETGTLETKVIEGIPVCSRIPEKSLTQQEKELLLQLMGPKNESTLKQFSLLYAERFYDQLRSNQQAIKRLTQKTQTYTQLLGQVKLFLLKTASGSLVESLIDMSSKCTDLIKQLQACPFLVFREQSHQITAVENTLDSLFRGLVRLLYDELRKNPGHINPQLNTNAVRLFLCQLLDIKPQPPRYMSGQEAALLDARIVRRCLDFGNRSFPQELKSIKAPFQITPEPKALYLCETRLTPRILAQLATNWLYALDPEMAPGKPFPTPCLSALFNALNHIPLDCHPDTVLKEEWCTEHLKKWLDSPEAFHEMSPEHKSEPFLFALNNSQNFMSTKKQKAESADDQVNISDLDEAMALYERQPASAKLTSYMSELYAEFKGEEAAVAKDSKEPLVERKIHPKEFTSSPIPLSLFQRGRFRNLHNGHTGDMALFSQCLTHIRRRHAEPVDSKTEFSLNEGDIQLLLNFLKRRWEKLLVEARPGFPTNYLKLGAKAATDHICLLLANVAKRALRNLGREIELTDILMPGPKLLDPTTHKGISDIKVIVGTETYSICPDDEFSLKNIIALPDGSWFPKNYFVELYKRGEPLQDFFRCTPIHGTLKGRPLTEKEVQHIVEQYPDVADQLLPVFTARYMNPLTDDIKDVFLNMVKNLDMRTFGGFPDRSSPDYIRSEEAHVKLESYVQGLPEQDRLALYQLKVPGTGGFLERYFTMDESAKAATCVSQYTLRLALTLWAYRPDIPASDFEPLYNYNKRVFDDTPRISFEPKPFPAAENPIHKYYQEKLKGRLKLSA